MGSELVVLASGRGDGVLVVAVVGIRRNFRGTVAQFPILMSVGAKFEHIAAMLVATPDPLCRGKGGTL